MLSGKTACDSAEESIDRIPRASSNPRTTFASMSDCVRKTTVSAAACVMPQ